MILRINGTYNHPIGECEVAINRSAEKDEADRIWAERVTFTIRPKIISQKRQPAEDIRNKLAILNSVYTDYLSSIGLFYPNGMPSLYVLSSVNTLGGIQVIKRPSAPTMQGANLVTWHDLEIEVTALVPTTFTDRLVSFSEELTVSGGGTRYGHLEPLDAAPIKQRLKQQTIYKATQSGSAMGLFSRPDVSVIAPPIFPADLVEQNPTISKRSPMRRGSASTDYFVSWSYQYESASQLVGEPNSWPGF